MPYVIKAKGKGEGYYDYLYTKTVYEAIDIVKETPELVLRVYDLDTNKEVFIELNNTTI